MEARLDYYNASPGVVRALIGLETYLARSGLEKPLRELVKLRASQINGCAFCLDMHWQDARQEGEHERRLYLPSAWRESPAWTEAVTKLDDGHVPDEVFAAVRSHFPDKELADLTLAIAAINAWNRMSISFRAVPGSTLGPTPSTKLET
jgi:AhpD family alkylhydroperoxidase